MQVAEPASNTGTSTGLPAIEQTRVNKPNPAPVSLPVPNLIEGTNPAESQKSEYAGQNSPDGHASLNSSTNAAPSVFYRIGTQDPPSVQASAALVADLQTGESYFELNRHQQWPLASLTKLMTAVMVMRTGGLNRSLSLTPADFSVGAGTNFFKAGYAYSVNDVLHIMLLLSKNEAAEALANLYGRDTFIAGLNQLAREWGLAATHFADPAGLSIANQSTIDDLEKCILNIRQSYPEIFTITRRQKIFITELNSKKKTLITNINLFAGRNDFLGGKTGYTDDANGNLVSLFSYQKRPILIIVLGTDDRFGETERLFNWFKQNFRSSR